MTGWLAVAGLGPGADNLVTPEVSAVLAEATDIVGYIPYVARVAARPGWQDVPAVRHGQLFEIKSADILQPGPAALTDGVEQLHRIVTQWMDAHG